MMNIEKSIRERKSVRTFDGQELSKEDREKLSEFMKKLELPFDMKIEFQFLEGMNCPVVVGTNLYVGAKLKDLPFFNEAFGYAFEKFILYAQSLGIGTVWIGGTMDRALFEKAGEAIWECRNCGHLVMGKKAPEVCPVCAHPKSYFEVRKENY
jgi:rubredoxin